MRCYCLRVGLGIFCSTSDNRLSTNHKIRLSNLNEENVFRVFHRNLSDFFELLELSRRMKLTIFRLGSDFIPFASHPLFQQSWFERIERILADNAARVRGFGVRITMHPAQFVVLNSPKRDVVERSLAELRYHFRVLDSLGLGRESIVVVHMGGVYGSKREALRRLYATLEENRWLLKRLALENDERYYTIAEVIEVAESFGIPAVYDHYHHKLNPSEFSVDRLLATWGSLTPEVHVSSKPDRPHRFGEHGDYVTVEDFVEMLSIFPQDSTIDVIVEAKMKERAIERLVRELEERRPELLEAIKGKLP